MGGSQRFCVGCGHKLRQGGRFCTECGRVVGQHGERPAVADDGMAAAPGPRVAAVQPGPAAPASLSPPATIPAAPTERPPGPASSSPWLTGHGPSPGPDESGPDQPHRGHSRWPLVVVLVVLLVGGAAGAGVFFLHSSHKTAAAVRADQGSQPAARSPSPVSATASSAGQSPQRQAAESLASLLAQSVTDRSSVVSAVSDVKDCGPGLTQDPQAFQAAATSRQNLLSRLGDLPGRSALPGPMLQALTGAWQASVQADQDFGQWAQDEVSQGCVQDDHSDPGYQAAAGPDRQATTDKKSFAKLWNPLAARYGLTPYQWNQL